ncbi:MAG: tRNA 2-selenouridine(34) synthase MnmH [Spirochaetes bacterium]|nr:tRNA 2-selenouridine(34) synthase MnmH [Spirochaetota bacterium]
MNDPLEITFEESLKLDNPLYVDVRAPIEYDEDHIPGAINLPIFNDEERKEVGTLYKILGKDEAIKRGAEIGGKRIVDIIKSLTDIKDKTIIIYCARGGMRSASVASIINSLGTKTYKIINGYKSFRKNVLEYLSTVIIKPKIFILQGFTGTGKTEILRFINNSIDLEAIAGHRSSIFGGIGLRQKSQKFFETSLWNRLEELKNEKFIIFEGESRKIGNLHIPENIFNQMREGAMINIEAPMGKRIEIIRNEYSEFCMNEAILKIVNSLRKRLGSKKTDMLIEFYNNGNIDEFIRILLLDYYDILYKHTLDRYEYIDTVINNNSKEACNRVLEIIDKYMDM